MKQGMNLYFVAIIPPQELCDKITAIKQDFAERFGSKHALKVIPHITLKAPFSVYKDAHDVVVNWFKNIPVDIPAFEQKLKNFGSFSNKRNPVIFIEPELSSALKQLQKLVLHQFIKSFPSIQVPLNEKKFYPHITIAYRDLTYADFQLAWDEFISKNFESVFLVNEIHLLQHDGGKWNSIARNSLQ